MGKGETDRAIADFNQAIRLEPRMAAPDFLLGLTHRRTGEYNRASADYAEAIRLDPRLASLVK